MPALFSRVDPRLSKKDFGHLLIIAGSPAMLGAAALSSLAAMRSGAGMVTAAVPKSLNLTLQRKISHVVMTLPLAEDSRGCFSLKAYDQLKKIWDRFDAIAIGPGIGREAGIQKLVCQTILHCPKPLVIDADALFALAKHPAILLKSKAPRVLTPHSGEMSRLTGLSVKKIEGMRKKTALDFAHRFNCVLLLKGHQTVVASAQGDVYINHTGNAGMATAGSGDVLTGIITAFLGQGMNPFEAAKYGAYYHGKSGDLAAQTHGKSGMIASDMIDYLSSAFKGRSV